MDTQKSVVSVDLGTRSYDIHVGPGLLDALGDIVREQSAARQITIVTDRNVAPHYSIRAVRSLESAGFAAKTITIEPGESSKSLDTAARLYDGLAERLRGRQDPIVALGGGVVGDLAGFVAATWMRGVPFIQCPTTTEAMIDAGVGGKTAVNHASGKNLIGAFHQPAVVVMDTLTTKSLNDRDFIAGLAESVKHALIADADFLDWHEQNAGKIRERDASILTELIVRNCRIKAAVVAEDERETSTTGVGRAVLNFGHTLGHALESASQGQLRHGEAVSLGMVAALDLSVRHCDFPESRRRQAESLLEAMQLPKHTDLRFSFSELIDRMRHDKKNTDRIRLVLLRDVGQPAWFLTASEAMFGAAMGRIIGPDTDRQH